MTAPYLNPNIRRPPTTSQGGFLSNSNLGVNGPAQPYSPTGGITAATNPVPPRTPTPAAPLPSAGGMISALQQGQQFTPGTSPTGGLSPLSQQFTRPVQPNAPSASAPGFGAPAPTPTPQPTPQVGRPPIAVDPGTAGGTYRNPNITPYNQYGGTVPGDPGVVPPSVVNSQTGGGATAPTTTPAGATPSAPPGYANIPGAAANQFGPDSNLISTAITPGSTADRYALAQQYWNQFADASDPQYQKDLRTAMAYGAAAGGVGSGALSSTLGDISLQRENQLRNAQAGFLTNALQGTIADQEEQRNELRGERGYQQGLNEQALQQRIQQAALEAQIRGENVNQILGEANYSNAYPTYASLFGSQQYGQSAAGTNAALQQYMQELAQQQGGGGVSAPPVGVDQGFTDIYGNTPYGYQPNITQVPIPQYQSYYNYGQ